MGKPYSDLEKRAIAILSGGGDPATSQDQELAKYWKWRLNPSATSHDLPEASIRDTGRKLDDVAIEPFGVVFEGTNVYAKASISQRAKEFFSPKLADLGVKAIDNTVKAYRLGRFKPARVYARKGAGTTSAPRTSRITGRKYKSYYQEADQGYSAPFGKKTGTDTQAGRQLIVQQAVKAIDAATINLITFTPEKVKP
jgi:hypothetical protein